MGLRTIAASIVCKGTYKLLRLLGRGGTSLPGNLALKVDPNYLGTLGKGVKTIVLTGTNGKTTTTHIVAQALSNAGTQAFYNRSGANMIQGIVTEFALHSSLNGKPKCAYAAVECDEGAMARVCAALDPDIIVVTNVFRDQLDRYGEVMHTRESILKGLSAAPHAHVLLNADCSITASLADEIENEVSFYGVDCEIYPKRVPDISDATHCIKCGAPYEYEYVTYAHLGGFRCPECGWRRPDTRFAVTKILERGTNNCVLEMRVGDELERVPVDVAADYDVYNCAAALSAMLLFGFSRQEAYNAVGHFKHGFGRGEVFDFDGTKVRLALTKNPVGCNQIINLLLNEPEGMQLACILNDQDCDGNDVSWIYDASWEPLVEQLGTTYFSGCRAEDMALRLKYAGLSAANIRIEKDYEKLIDILAAQDHPTTVVANYSAMCEFREHVAARLGLAGFWEG